MRTLMQTKETNESNGSENTCIFVSFHIPYFVCNFFFIVFFSLALRMSMNCAILPMRKLSFFAIFSISARKLLSQFYTYFAIVKTLKTRGISIGIC